MTFAINPNIAAGPIKFGMNRAEIHGILDQKSIAFKRGGSTNETDNFVELGLFIEYNEALECIAIEMAKPAIAFYRDHNLLGLSFKQIIKLLGDDDGIEKDDSGFTSYLHGIGGYFEKKSIAESIIVFKKGYYNNKNAWKQKLDSVDFTKMTSEEIDEYIDKYTDSM